MLEEVERDATPLKRCEERRKSGRNTGSATRRCKVRRTSRGEVKKQRSLEEGLPRLREENSEKAARNCKIATGVVCDGFQFQKK